ncbi:FliI/YscN family ATPase [Limnohabitans sp. 2KL-17]|uniref:FliI/YscN family ATPase n=1 Tax=Limnohabitans sp. 2KL-17 TaxID=1100704 RepID=UPI001E2D3403|nr:FliI/YscN family ATPase [Limnohabitans sp. 2KL-17]
MHPSLHNFQQLIDSKELVQAFGYVRQVLGTLIEAEVTGVSIGELCEIFHPARPHQAILSEVIGFTTDSTLLSPLSALEGLSTSFLIKPLHRVHCVSIGFGLMGRVLNGFGQPLDGMGPVAASRSGLMERQVLATAPPPLERPRIVEPFATGVRAVDSMLTIGKGQRVGIFAGPGCGKTTLMAAIGRGSDVDVLVIGLIGERGREVREFTEHELDPELLKKTVIVCATSDRTSIERVRAAFTATAIAEGFRDQGLRVLLMIDSLTRLSRAQREIGLAAGETPARAGFPPSVYALLPRLIERAGLTEQGSITAFYTVLLEGELKADPISEEAVSLLDGHILLSRKLAESGHYPAIDILPSISRVMSNIVDREHGAAAMRARLILSRYRDMELLIRLGEYKPGLDNETDALITAYPKVVNMLKQNTKLSIPWDESLQQLMECTHS